MGKLALTMKMVGILMVVPLVLAVVPAGNSSHTQTIPCTDTNANGGTVCPDLIVEPAKLNVHYEVQQSFTASSCDVEHGHTVPGERTLMRFYFSTPNIGEGALHVGAPRDHPEWFTWNACHNHHHFREYADYRLWTVDGYAAYTLARQMNPDATAQEIFEQNPELLDSFVTGDKRGFCVIDLFPYAPVFGTAEYGSCSNNQGITPGWADEYVPGLSGQWVDVTDVDPGLYILEAEVNAERLYVESDYSNNSSAVPVVVASA